MHFYTNLNNRSVRLASVIKKPLLMVIFLTHLARRLCKRTQLMEHDSVRVNNPLNNGFISATLKNKGRWPRQGYQDLLKR